MQTEHDDHPQKNEFDCASCGCDRIVLEPDSTSRCPDRGESFSLVVHDGLVLDERNGWTTRVATDSADAATFGLVDG